jgi:hypothetical protein
MLLKVPPPRVKGEQSVPAVFGADAVRRREPQGSHVGLLQVQQPNQRAQLEWRPCESARGAPRNARRWHCSRYQLVQLAGKGKFGRIDSWQMDVWMCAKCAGCEPSCLRKRGSPPLVGACRYWCCDTAWQCVMPRFVACLKGGPQHLCVLLRLSFPGICGHWRRGAGAGHH